MKSFDLARVSDDALTPRGLPFLLFIVLLIAGSILWPSEHPLNSAGLWFVVARDVCIALLLAWFWPSYVELRTFAVPASRWVEATLAGLAVFLLWIYLDQDWAKLSKPRGFNPESPDGGVNWLLASLRLMGLALVIPVMEELFWRSFVLRWISRHDFLSVAPAEASARAFVITTVLFALEHDQWLAGAIAGATYSWLYMRSGSLWIPVLSHAVTNLALGLWVLGTRQWHFW